MLHRFPIDEHANITKAQCSAHVKPFVLCVLVKMSLYMMIQSGSGFQWQSHVSFASTICILLGCHLVENTDITIGTCGTTAYNILDMLNVSADLKLDWSTLPHHLWHMRPQHDPLLVWHHPYHYKEDHIETYKCMLSSEKVPCTTILAKTDA